MSLGSRIAPKLWQGPCPPSFQRVIEDGFSLVVFCADEIQPTVLPPRQLQVLYAPMDDNAARPINDEEWALAVRAARLVATASHAGERCLVTCAAGLNRSGLVSALALHYRFGVPGRDAIALVRRGPGPAALHNASFVARLLPLPARQPLS